MPGRSRHGLHVVKDGDAPAPIPPILLDARGRASISLQQRSVVLCIGGLLNADTAGRLRMFLSMFTMDGGPGELLLDLSATHAVDEDGMAPVHEADEAMRLRRASLQLVSVSPAVAHYLKDARVVGTLTVDPPSGGASSDCAGAPAVCAADDGRPHPEGLLT